MVLVYIFLLFEENVCHVYVYCEFVRQLVDDINLFFIFKCFHPFLGMFCLHVEVLT